MLAVRCVRAWKHVAGLGFPGTGFPGHPDHKASLISSPSFIRVTAGNRAALFVAWNCCEQEEEKMLLSGSTCVATRPQRNVAVSALNVKRREIIEAGAAALLLPGGRSCKASSSGRWHKANCIHAICRQQVPRSRISSHALQYPQTSGSLTLALSSAPAGMLPASASAAGGAYDFEALQYDATVPLSKYKGQVLVVVNIASE